MRGYGQFNTGHGSGAMVFVYCSRVRAGSIPKEVGDLAELEYLGLHDNKLTGEGKTSVWWILG